jgi:two-component system alkaline phosphatase synthesis response regulator PhoP/two-component system response regulator VicR
MARKILACDDEAGILQLIRVNLERAGYEVVTATDGRDALGKIRTERPDLVILDVMMPYTDGFGVLQQIRASAQTRELPVLLLTARSSDADTLRAWQEGADCYLTKPFNPLELLTFVGRIFEGGAPSGGTTEPMP